MADLILTSQPRSSLNCQSNKRSSVHSSLCLSEDDNFVELIKLWNADSRQLFNCAWNRPSKWSDYYCLKCLFPFLRLQPRYRVICCDKKGCKINKSIDGKEFNSFKHLVCPFIVLLNSTEESGIDNYYLPGNLYVRTIIASNKLIV